jgi:hypothetical protein
MNDPLTPGPITLFGSGETSPSGRKIFEHVLRALCPSPKIALLETPAGFELNSPQVIGRIAEFIDHRLQNFDPHLEVIPARRKGTIFSPDIPELVAPILESDLVFMGPGSPTYAVRQLRDSLAWQYILARHALGAALAFSSAAVIACGAFALPVYEIYKVGEDPHWKPGLDLFSLYSLSLTFVPHWNNNEGGAELDTSRCFVGQARFGQLLAMLPSNQTLVGIDEHTGLSIDCTGGQARVLGKGTVTVLRNGAQQIYESSVIFPLVELGPCQKPDVSQVIPAEIWQQALAANHVVQGQPSSGESPPSEVQALVEQREKARTAKDWPTADALRDQIATLGWQVTDTPEGPMVGRQ